MGRDPPCHASGPGSPLSMGPAGKWRVYRGPGGGPAWGFTPWLVVGQVLVPGCTGGAGAGVAVPLTGHAGGLLVGCWLWCEPAAWQRAAAGSMRVVGLQVEEVRGSPGRRGWVCCMAPCPALPVCLCVPHRERGASARVQLCVRGESRRGGSGAGGAGEALPSRGLLGSASRGARVASPKLPVRPYVPREAVLGKEMVLPARASPALLLPRRGSVWPGAARGWPGGGEAICERRRRG